MPRSKKNSSDSPSATPDAVTQDPVRVMSDLARAGRHAQAIQAANAALQRDDLSASLRLRLFEGCADSRLCLYDLPAAGADAQAMRALALRSKSAAQRARALACLAHVQTRQERIDAAGQSATDALAAARRCRPGRERDELVALALLRQATAGMLARAAEARSLAAEQAADAARRAPDAAGGGPARAGVAAGGAAQPLRHPGHAV